MARHTIYLAQGFSSTKGNRLNAAQPLACRTAEAAQRTAEKLGATHAGAVAFLLAQTATPATMMTSRKYSFEPVNCPMNLA